MTETQTISATDVGTVDAAKPAPKPTPREVLEENLLWPDFTRTAERYLHRLDAVIEPDETAKDLVAVFRMPHLADICFDRLNREAVAITVNVAARYAVSPKDLRELLSAGLE